jgi:hypothetical protein
MSTWIPDSAKVVMVNAGPVPRDGAWWYSVAAAAMPVAMAGWITVDSTPLKVAACPAGTAAAVRCTSAPNPLPSPVVAVAGRTVIVVRAGTYPSLRAMPA